MTKPLLTAAEMAKLLKVNRTTIWRWEKQGIVKGVKIGGAKRYEQPNTNHIVTGKQIGRAHV